jgi:hypothetical protein
LGNFAYDGICQAFCNTRNQFFKPTPQNHDLQKAFLQALRDGIRTTAQRHRGKIPRSEAARVKQWYRSVNQTLVQLAQEVSQGAWLGESRTIWRCC